jgi:membrane associated rhomboid family serine protease
VGASGGIMGLLGFLLALSVRQRHQLPGGYARSLVSGVLWTAVAGLAAYAFIDNAAHAGGLLAGLALGRWLLPSEGPVPVPASGSVRAAGVTALAVLALTAVACGVILIASRS